MTQLIRTDSANSDYIELVKELDIDLAVKDGEFKEFYAHINKNSIINNVVIVYHNNTPIACGSFKIRSESIVEIKRMYVIPSARGKGVASKILAELEEWAVALGYNISILETGTNQPDAIHLYKKNGYKIIPNFEPYINMSYSICFEKNLL